MKFDKQPIVEFNQMIKLIILTIKKIPILFYIVNNPNIELYVVEYKGKLIGYMDFGITFRTFKDYNQEIGLFIF